jgi:lipid-A-disaccharide synthase
MPSSTRIFISCIEASADLYAAKILEQIPDLKKKYQLFGFGGKYLQRLGMTMEGDLTIHSTIGFLEPLFKLPLLIKKLNLAKKLLREKKPKVLMVVDGQGFHLPLIAYAKKLGIRVIYLIAPQVWQWGDTRAAHKFIENIDLLLDIFPEATQFYQKIHAHSHWIGHPLLDIAQARLSEDEFKKQNQVREHQKVVGIFPGSRKQEVERLLPLFLKVCEQLVGEHVFIISCAHPELLPLIQKHIQHYPRPIQINHDSRYELMRYASVCLTASGTATLEMCILEAVPVVAYRFNPLSFGLLKLILGKKAPPFIAWPNIMAKRQIIPEFLQDEASVSNLVKICMNLLQVPERREEIKLELRKVKQSLGELGATRRASVLMAEFL